MRKTTRLCLIAVAFGLAGFACTTVAMASTGAELADDPAGILRLAYQAATAKQWTVLAGAAMIGVTYAVRRWVLHRVAWFQTRLGGFALALGLSLLGTFGLALASGAEMSAQLALDALGTAMAAAGGWAWLQNALAKRDGDA
jgi:hypothetical protein